MSDKPVATRKRTYASTFVPRLHDDLWRELDGGSLWGEHLQDELSWADVERLSADPDFIESCADFELSPSDVLGSRLYTKADKCSSPISAARIHPVTGEVSTVRFACESNSEHLCKSCSEYKRRLRTVQLMSVLGDTSRVQNVLFYTLTAPSFGAVHRSTWTKKDAFRHRALDSAELYRKRLFVQRSREASRCSCGDHHTFEDGFIGTPVGSYDYVAETLWSTNLPRLMKSTRKQLLYRLDTLGVEKDRVRMFSVYERQARGSLHAHFLIVVEGRSSRSAASEFASVLANLSEYPLTASAELPSDLLRDAVASTHRLAADADVLAASRTDDPTALVSSSIPADGVTRWGRIFDVRALTPDEREPADDDGEFLGDDVSQPDSYLRAAAYVAKYLTKGQSSFAPEVLRDAPPALRSHLSRFRRTAVLLLGEGVVRTALTRSILRRLDEVSAAADAVSSSENAETVARFFAELGLSVSELDSSSLAAYAEALRADLERGELPRSLTLITDVAVSFAASKNLTLDFMAALPQVLTPGMRTGDARYLLLDNRYLKMKLNRVASNGGFTGTLSTQSRWGVTLQMLRAKQREFWALQHPDEVDAVDYVWELAADDLDTWASAKERVKPLLADYIGEGMRSSIHAMEDSSFSLDFTSPIYQAAASPPTR